MFTSFTFDAEQAAAWAQCAQGTQHLALDAYPQISTLLKALTGSVPGFKSIKLRVRNNSDCKMLLGLITNRAMYEGPRDRPIPSRDGVRGYLGTCKPVTGISESL